SSRDACRLAATPRAAVAARGMAAFHRYAGAGDRAVAGGRSGPRRSVFIHTRDWFADRGRLGARRAHSAMVEGETADDRHAVRRTDPLRGQDVNANTHLARQ